jgi:hypothetical protein
LPPPEAHESPEMRALSTADYVAEVWSGWLATEEQRLRRITDPRTGASPWIMPESLCSPEPADFPRGFGRQVQPEPLKRC